MPDLPPIRKRLVTDEHHRPVAVQILYADWLEIEHRLGLAEMGEEGNGPSEAEPPGDESTSGTEAPNRSDPYALAAAARPFWQGGDGLAFQRRIRAEWTDPWKRVARESDDDQPEDAE